MEKFYVGVWLDIKMEQFPLICCKWTVGGLIGVNSGPISKSFMITNIDSMNDSSYGKQKQKF